AVLAPFGMLSLLLFLFDRRRYTSLYFALFTISAALSSRYLLLFPALTFGEMVFLLWLLYANWITILRLLYSIYYQRTPRQFWFCFGWFGIVTLAALVPGFGTKFVIGWWSATSIRVVYLLPMMLGYAEVVRVLARAVWKKQPGAWLLGTGFATVSAAIL